MKRISELMTDLPVKEVRGDLSTLIREVQYDSRKVMPQDIFVAIRGYEHDGHAYIPQAYEQGCRAFVVESKKNVPEDAVCVQVRNTRRQLPFIARNFYENTVKDLKVIGITGTNGKTTTAYLIHSILNAAHWKPGLISTVETIVGKNHYAAERTTPESLDLHRAFYEMYRQRSKSAVMEVSSHALALHRVDAVPFVAAVFTYLGHDHLDFHRTKEKYFLAKKKLFDGLGQNDRAIVNLDDPYSQRIIRDTEGDVFTYSMKDPGATVYLNNVQMLPDGMALQLKLPSGDFRCTTHLAGKFNIYNVLAAAACAVSLGLQEEFILKGIEALENIPGRCEKFISEKGFKVYVDYAHTPDALQRILEALLAFKPHKLTVVFGCGGDRDRTKRPMMGKIAEDYADRIILTSDNPRSEDPLAILNEIKAGIFDQAKVAVIENRREAIEVALAEAVKKEIVLIAGKGHENYQVLADKVVHCDDREIVSDLIQYRN